MFFIKSVVLVFILGQSSASYIRSNAPLVGKYGNEIEVPEDRNTVFDDQQYGNRVYTQQQHSIDEAEFVPSVNSKTSPINSGRARRWAVSDFLQKFLESFKKSQAASRFTTTTIPSNWRSLEGDTDVNYLDVNNEINPDAEVFEPFRVRSEPESSLTEEVESVFNSLSSKPSFSSSPKRLSSGYSTSFKRRGGDHETRLLNNAPSRYNSVSNEIRHRPDVYYRSFGEPNL